MPGPRPLTDDQRIQRFWSFVEKTDDCWLWHGGHNGETEYGAFSIGGGKKIGAHRFSYELVNGSIAEGLVLDHLCRVRDCVNPAHMQEVSHRENILRGIGASASHAAQTHCKNGHEFTEENTYRRPTGQRVCRTCSSERDKKRLNGWQRQRNKEAAIR